MEPMVSQGPLKNILTIPGYRVAAKTGTAEVAENGRYTSDRIVSVAGLVPADDPQYAIVVTLREAGYDEDFRSRGARLQRDHEAGHQDLPDHPVDGTGAQPPAHLVSPGRG